MTTFAQLSARLKNFLRGWLLVLGIKEGLVECATVCVKSVVILQSLPSREEPRHKWGNHKLCSTEKLFYLRLLFRKILRISKNVTKQDWSWEIQTKEWTNFGIICYIQNNTLYEIKSSNKRSGLICYPCLSHGLGILVRHDTIQMQPTEQSFWTNMSMTNLNKHSE